MFTKPVKHFMISPVHTAREDDRLVDVEKKLSELGISALPVVDAHARLLGVISRTDLLRAGRVRVQNGYRKHVLTLPDAKVREFMHSGVEVVGPEKSLHEAASRMIRQRIQRLYVSEDGRLFGVLGTREMMQAAIHARVAPPLKDFMNTSIITVRATDPLSLAIDRMAAVHHHGLVVVDEQWPVGMFTQVEALCAREAPPDKRVEEWMDPSILCLPAAIPAFRAAEQALATRARTILVVDREAMRGIITAFDFVRLIKAI